MSGTRRLVARPCVGVAGLLAVSATASAHEFGHGGGGHATGAAFVVVLGMPTLAGLLGGVAAVRRGRRRVSESAHRGSSVAVGLLLAGLGAASLLQVATGDLRLAVAGGAVGAGVALLVDGRGTRSGAGCGNHAELALGAVFTHRLLEGVVLGALYGAGRAVGLLGAVALAGHTALETAAVGGLFATAQRRTRLSGAILLVQVGYVAGAIAGLGVADAVPAPVRTLALAVVGGTILVVGTSETAGSVVARGRAPVERRGDAERDTMP